jgi:cytochrome oxidase assembly protein ShyY1
LAWSFRPAAWSVLGTVAGCALTIHLGLWQLHRGRDKAALDRQYAAAALQAPQDLGAGPAPAASIAAIGASAQGEYLPERQLLLDDQVRRGMPGYEVWTPLRLKDGRLLIVNRGWIPQGADRRKLPPLPAPAGAQSLRGLWRALPEPGIRLGTPCDPAHPPAQWPRTVLYPTATDLVCFYGEPVLAGELLLAPEAEGGYLRDWRVSDSGFPPARHYGYAAQWFAFALTLLVLFLKLNLKRKPPAGGNLPKP